MNMKMIKKLTIKLMRFLMDFRILLEQWYEIYYSVSCAIVLPSISKILLHCYFLVIWSILATTLIFILYWLGLDIDLPKTFVLDLKLIVAKINSLQNLDVLLKQNLDLAFLSMETNQLEINRLLIVYSQYIVALNSYTEYFLLVLQVLLAFQELIAIICF